MFNSAFNRAYEREIKNGNLKGKKCLTVSNSENCENCIIKPYEKKYMEEAAGLWNEVVEEQDSFPQNAPFKPQEAHAFFESQTRTACLFQGEKMLGIYILHPNNAGNCGHIANCSYGLTKTARGRGLGRLLVEDSITEGKKAGFRAIQFNAVVSTNYPAIKLYRSLGFRILATVPGGYKHPDGTYTDTYIMFKELV